MEIEWFFLYNLADIPLQESTGEIDLEKCKRIILVYQAALFHFANVVHNSHHFFLTDRSFANFGNDPSERTDYGDST